jgi:hypothetical protein
LTRAAIQVLFTSVKFIEMNNAHVNRPPGLAPACGEEDPAFKRVSFENWEHLFGYLVERADS